MMAKVPSRAADGGPRDDGKELRRLFLYMDRGAIYTKLRLDFWRPNDMPGKVPVYLG